jgi:glycosyltransferase involved in cell wall biosynthesis
MKQKPFFSIIIPALNEELDLPLLLQDLANQSFKSFEVILVDGHSEDKTIKKAEEFAKELPSLTIINSPKRNVSTQRNLGAKTAKGKYLLFNDADNRLPEFFLEGIKYNLSRKPSDVFTCWCAADTSKTADKTIATILNMAIETAELIDYPGALGALIGCKTNKFSKVGGFDPKLPFAEDGEFVRRAYRKKLKFTIYRSPKFVVSLRRFRKEGRLKALQQYAKLHLKIITQKNISRQEYPMGGQAFKDNPGLQTFFNKIQTTLKVVKEKPQLKKRLRSLIHIFEDNGF